MRFLALLVTPWTVSPPPAGAQLIETQSEAAFNDAYRFQGATLVELLQHLMNKGLEFAPPEPGDEATYRHLFGAIRALYLQAVPKPEAH